MIPIAQHWCKYESPFPKKNFSVFDVNRFEKCDSFFFFVGSHTAALSKKKKEKKIFIYLRNLIFMEGKGLHNWNEKLFPLFIVWTARCTCFVTQWSHPLFFFLSFCQCWWWKNKKHLQNRLWYFVLLYFFTAQNTHTPPTYELTCLFFVRRVSSPVFTVSSFTQCPLEGPFLFFERQGQIKT